MLNIGGLHQGVVIDHIKAGQGMQIYEYLELGKLDCCVAIIKNATSNKMGRKDIIKIEGPIMPDLDALAVLDPDITLNIIENDVIVEKRRVRLPEEVTNILRCKNPRCITSIEQELPHRFRLTNKEKRIYRCVYCEQKYKETNLLCAENASSQRKHWQTKDLLHTKKRPAKAAFPFLFSNISRSRRNSYSHVGRDCFLYSITM